MRKILIILLVLVAATRLLSSLHAQELTVGVVEFEEKNSIGLENAGRIVAEWTVTEMRRLGTFRIAERLLMQQVLEEQKLILSGVIDAGQAVEIGRIYGVDAIVTGSVMKVGETINLTARIINVETGEVLKTASGRVTDLAQLERETYVVANALADISREEFQVREAIAEKSVRRLEIGAGVGNGWDSSDYSGLLLDVLFRYQSPLFGLWIEGAPAGVLQSVELGGYVNPVHYLGVGSVVGKVFDNSIDYVDVTYLLFGLAGRPVVDVEFGLFFGGSLGGTIWTEAANSVDVDGSWGIGGNYLVWVQYRVNDSYLVQLRVQGAELLDFADQLPSGYAYPNPDYEYGAGKISIIFTYSFPI